MSLGFDAMGLCILLTASFAAAAPTVQEEAKGVVVTGEQYRATFVRETMDVMLEIKGTDGQWHTAVKRGAVTFAYFRGDESHTAGGLRATWTVHRSDHTVVIGQQAVLDPATSTILDLHYLCTDSGVLLGARLAQRIPDDGQGRLWSPPRMGLSPADWAGYLFWGSDGKLHEGRIADLAPPPAYAGVSPWEQQGDTVKTLEPNHPALIVKSSSWGADLGVVFVHYADRWAGSQMFLQRHTPTALWLYAGYSPVARAQSPLWAWLAPFPQADTPTNAARVERLVREGESLVKAFRPISQPVPEEWTRPLPDFPPALRRREPVRDINEAVVFTVNEFTASDDAVALARKVGSDVLIRGWFKWAQAPPVQTYRDIPAKVHQIGALFGGGITCSALYDNENGIAQAQLLDMATRGPAGQLIDAWDTPDIRHGSLSSPAYLDYLFRWCREQMDAGANYLFMDEHTAALSGLEGYDDHSLSDFRRYLLRDCPQTRGWTPHDPRWMSELKIDLRDPQICPTGNMESFNYRAYLKAKGCLDNPTGANNTFSVLWHQFRAHRDDRAWKTLTDRIRAYAREKGRTVLISANGIAKYVDLQVLGVWGQWVTKDGHIDLTQSQLPYWRSLVMRGQESVRDSGVRAASNVARTPLNLRMSVTAERRVPVVLFHDWGFGDPPFPWLAVPPSEREVWMRTRGAEIYAAGGFFAFPVLGPFGCDAGRDGTLPTIAKQTRFYQTHRDLYLRGRYLGSEPLRSVGAVSERLLSLAAWWSDQPRALLLHVINRNLKEGRLLSQKNVGIEVPVNKIPQKVTVISPDWEGERPAICRKTGNGVEVTLTDLEAYAVVLLHYTDDVDLHRVKDPARVVPVSVWARPARSEFRVRANGSVEHASELNGFLQGILHTHLRNPPTFFVNAVGEAKLSIKVRAVAATGARLEYRVDGKTMQTVDLPDRDGKNDGDAAEYDQVFTFVIPAGQYRITLDNVGRDWLTVSWLEFQGTFREWREGSG